jgi:hypothetical protein
MSTEPFHKREIGPFVNKDGMLFYKLNSRSSLSCECIGNPYSQEIVELWEFHQRALSMLKNAHNILEDGSFLYAKDIRKFLAERE